MKKSVVAMVAVAGVGYGAYRWQSEAPPAPTHEVSVADRLWIDRIPRGERDIVRIFVAIDDESMGVFQSTSVWKGEYEAFRYEAHGNELRLVFPQTGQREKVVAKATECDRNGMDYCLEIDGASRGVKQYYSREGWEIGSLDAAKQLTTKLAGAAVPRR